MTTEQIDHANDPRGSSPTHRIPTVEVGAAFITYAFLLGIRVSGLASLFRYNHPGNPLAAPPLRSIGEFIFFDAILLAAVGLACSGILLALATITHSSDQYRRTKLIAGFGVGVPGLVYLLGSLAVALV